MFSEQLKRIQVLFPLVEAVNQPEVIAKTKFLYNRIKNPDSYVVLLGETSSGKSTLINGLLENTILPVNATPTTGTITEIEFCQDQPDRYYYINKEANIVQLDSIADFKQLAQKPSSDLKRLLFRAAVRKNATRGMRLFDTPGYNAITEEHDEVLMDFLPNSDVVIYMVYYRNRFGAEEAQMLRAARELLRDDVEFILVVNRCNPDTDQYDNCVRRCKEYTTDIIGKEPTTFIIHAEKPKTDETYPLIECPELWKHVNHLINSPARINLLKNAFDGFIEDLYYECDSIIQARLSTVNLKQEQYDELINYQKDTAKKLLAAIDDKINPKFEYIKSQIPLLVRSVRDKTVKAVKSEVEDSSKTDMVEMQNFITGHVLPFTVQQQSKEIQHFISVEVDQLNDDVQEYIQNELIKFDNKVHITLTTNVEKVGRNIVGTYSRNILVNGLGNYFAKFGGAGGANAGIANAAAHWLKKFGEISGLGPFRQQTYPALQRMISRIGFTSMKTISAVIGVVIEIGSLVFDYNTWKTRLKGKIDKTMDQWQEDTVKMILKDVEELRIANINTLKKIADDISHCFESERPAEAEQCEKDAQLSQDISKVLGIKML